MAKNNGRKLAFWISFAGLVFGGTVTAGSYWVGSIKAQRDVENTVQSLADNYDELQEEADQNQRDQEDLKNEHTKTRQMVTGMKDDISEIKTTQKSQNDIILKIYERVK